MLNRFPRATAAIVTAGVLAAGGAIAASAHELSGVGSFEDSVSTATRVEQPEASPDVEEATGARIVFVEPSPEPTETPEMEDENEAPEAPHTITTTAPKRDSDEDSRTQSNTTTRHDD